MSASMDKNADFIRANKASSFFQAPSVLFDRLKELKIIPQNADEDKFQMLLTGEEKHALKSALNSTWDIYIAKQRRLKREIRMKEKKLERKRQKREDLEEKIESYEEKIAEAESEATVKAKESSLRIYQDRLESCEETIIKVEQQLEELKQETGEDGYDPENLKYDPDYSPLFNELQNLVYDGVSRARSKYGEYATIPAIKNNGNNGGDSDTGEQKEN